MIELTLHLIGGQSVKIECKDFERKTLNNELVELNYSWADGQTHRLNYTRLDAVAMIEWRDLPASPARDTSAGGS